jgi:hypothetical protein
MVHPYDQEKMTFTTLCGTFMYAKIPFGLMNARETFHRNLDMKFAEEKDKFIVIYLDDITVYLGSNNEHSQHLEHVFKKWRKIGISLNPKKSNFIVEEGKFPRHMLSRDGIKIDPNKVATLQKISIPRSKKEVQSFLGRVNFSRRFIPNLAEIINITKIC